MSVCYQLEKSWSIGMWPMAPFSETLEFLEVFEV